VINMPVEHTVDPARVPEAPLKPSYAVGGLHDVFHRRYLLRLLVQKELRARYSGSVLGLLWSYVMPLVRFCLYFFVIGVVLRLRDIPNFPIHLFSAMVFVHFFTETFSAGTRSIVQNKALVRKMAMPREMFPTSSVIVSAYHTIPQIVILLVAVLAIGWSPSWVQVGGGFLGMAILALFGTGLALAFSAANVFFRDFGQFVTMVTMFTHWMVPMIYPFTRVTESAIGGTWWEELYLANPLTEAVLLIQQMFWVPTCAGEAQCSPANTMPDHLYTRGFVMLAIGVVFLFLCQRLFTRLEAKFAERL
jgi:ABC-2 type transport system permease protein